MKPSGQLDLSARPSSAGLTVDHKTGSAFEVPSVGPNRDASTMTLPSQDTAKSKSEKKSESDNGTKGSSSTGSGTLSKMSLSVGSIIEQPEDKDNGSRPDDQRRDVKGNKSTNDSDTLSVLRNGTSSEAPQSLSANAGVSNPLTDGSADILLRYDRPKASDGDHFDDRLQNRQAKSAPSKQTHKDHELTTLSKELHGFNADELLFHDPTNEVADGLNIHEPSPAGSYTVSLKSQNENIPDKRKHFGLNEARQPNFAENKPSPDSRLNNHVSSELMRSAIEPGSRTMGYGNAPRSDLFVDRSHNHEDLSANVHSALTNQSFESNSMLEKAIEIVNDKMDRPQVSEVNHLSNLNEIGAIPNISNENDLRAVNRTTGDESNQNSGGISLEVSTHGPNSSVVTRKPEGLNKPVEFEDAVRRQNRPGRKFGAKKKLWVWSWFVQDQHDPNVAVCDFCGKVVRRRPSDKGSPKKLNEHLRTHKLNKTLVNPARAIAMEGVHSNYGSQPLQLLFNDNGSLLVLNPQQMHQVPIQALPSHSLAQQPVLGHEYNSHTLYNAQPFPHQGSDRERPSQDFTQGLPMTYSTNVPMKNQSHQNYNVTQMHPNLSRQPLPSHQMSQMNQNIPQNQQLQRGAQQVQPAHLGHLVHQAQQHPQNQNQSHLTNSIHPNYPYNVQNQVAHLNNQSKQKPQTYHGKAQAPPNPQSLQRQAQNNATTSALQTQVQHKQENSNPTGRAIKQHLSPDNDPISPEIHQQNNKRHHQLVTSGNERRNPAYPERQPEVNEQTETIEKRYMPEESFDDSPYSETKLFKHILAFLHENKLPINVVKLASFRQLIYDLRPESVKDLLVLDTVYSSCVEVARTSSNAPLSTDSVFPQGSSSDKIITNVIRR